MENIGAFVLVGFVAQLVDGALGMAYGVTSTTVLLSIGVSPVAASASVHAAEVFTTGVSGLSHWKLGNVDRTIIRRLIVPGVLGGIAGAYVLTAAPVGLIKPFVALYLMVMGGIILAKSIRRRPPARTGTRHMVGLGLAGGFLDAVGGGGWGPVVTSTLLARGGQPKFTIGSVNTTEFFVAAAQSVTFILTIGLVHWRIIVGLMAGGVLAAPLAAWICARMPARVLMFVVGALVIVLSLRTILLALA